MIKYVLMNYEGCFYRGALISPTNDLSKAMRFPKQGAFAKARALGADWEAYKEEDGRIYEAERRKAPESKPMEEGREMTRASIIRQLKARYYELYARMKREGEMDWALLNELEGLYSFATGKEADLLKWAQEVENEAD